MQKTLCHQVMLPGLKEFESLSISGKARSSYKVTKKVENST